MFEKNLKLSILLDFYGEVLDEHTRAVLRAYYDDDLSLAEIGGMVGISRQGVRHVIKKGEEQLLFLEDRLGLAERQQLLNSAALKLATVKEKLKNNNFADVSDIAGDIDFALSAISGHS